MKKVLLNLLLATPFLSFGQLNDPAPYCEIDYWGAQYTMINTLDIDGTIYSFGPQGSPSTSEPFVYENSLIFSDFQKGSALTFTVDFYSIDDGEPQYFGVFIDYNQNDVFDANELIMQTSNTVNMALPAFGQSTVTATLNVTIPSTALTGVTRMRIIRGEDLTPDAYNYDPTFDMVPCYDSQVSYVNYRDFDVKIVNGGTSTAIDENSVPSTAIYPNPSNGVFYVNKNIANVDVFSLDGKKIVSTTNRTLDLDGFKSGIYIVHLKDVSGKTTVTKIHLL